MTPRSNSFERQLREAYKRGLRVGLKRGMLIRESFEDPSAGIEKAKGIMMNIKNKLQSSKGNLSQEEYAKQAAKLFKMMEQLKTRHGDDAIKKAFGGDEQYYFWQHNMPSWLRDAIEQGYTTSALIRKEIKNTGATPGMGSKGQKQNYNKYLRHTEDNLRKNYGQKNFRGF